MLNFLMTNYFSNAGDKCGGHNYVSLYEATGPTRGVTITPDPEDGGYISAFGTTQFAINPVEGVFGFDVDFGDGSGVSTSVPLDVTHVYSTTGVHAVTVTATDLVGTLEVDRGILLGRGCFALICHTCIFVHVLKKIIFLLN